MGVKREKNVVYGVSLSIHAIEWPLYGNWPFLAPTGELIELLCHRGLRGEGLAVEGKITFFAITWIRVIHFECLCNNLDPVHRIQTQFGIDILIDPRNKPAEEFFFFLKIQDSRRRSKIEFRHNFGSKFTFQLGKWIPFIRFGPNLAGRYYSTLGTSLWKNFWPIAKSQMAPRPPLRQNTKSVIT